MKNFTTETAERAEPDFIVTLCVLHVLGGAHHLPCNHYPISLALLCVEMGRKSNGENPPLTPPFVYMMIDQRFVPSTNRGGGRVRATPSPVDVSPTGEGWGRGLFRDERAMVRQSMAQLIFASVGK